MHDLPTTPGSILYTRPDGRHVRLMAGGSQPGGSDPGGSSGGGNQQEGGGGQQGGHHNSGQNGGQNAGGTAASGGSGGGSGTGHQHSGGSGGGNDPGYPPNTPVEQMSSEQQAAYWKAQSRKHENRVNQLSITSEELKRLKQSDKELQEIRDKDKSDLDKANEQLASAQVRITELETDNLRRDAATAAGLNADMAQFITAADADTAKQQAETLAQRMGTTGGDGGGQQQQQQRQGAQYQQGTQNRGGQQASTVQSGRDLYLSRHGKSKQST